MPKKYIKNEKGQSIVELAILLPIILIILMGVFESGRVMNAYLIINHASREGARSASLGDSDTEILETVSLSSNTLNSSNMSVTISPSSRNRGDSVTVNIGYDVDIIVPIIESIIPNPFHIETETVMRVE